MYSNLKFKTFGKNVKGAECPCCGESVLLANDVCEILCIADADKAIAELDSDMKTEILVEPDKHKSKDSKIHSLPQKEVFITYSGLFSLILQSPLPMAAKLRKFLSDWYLNAIFVYGVDAENDLWMDDLERLREELKEKFGLISYESRLMHSDTQ